MGLVKLSATEVRNLQPSQEDIERVNNIRDEDIVYTDDMPEITEEMAKNMMTPLEFQARLKQIHKPTKAFDDDVVEWVSRQDKNTRDRVNEMIRQVMAIHTPLT